MEKPITIIREEMRESFANIINSNTNVPAFIIVDILEKLLFELKEIEHTQLENDKRIYEKSLDDIQQEAIDKTVAQEVANGDTE